jgi:hypothetical protein
MLGTYAQTNNYGVFAVTASAFSVSESKRLMLFLQVA